MLLGLIEDPSREPRAGRPADAARRARLVPRARGAGVTTFEVDRTPLYRDPALAVDERVDDLLARMTLEEKVAQLGSRWVFELADGDGARRRRAPACWPTGSARSRASRARAACVRARRPSSRTHIQRHLVEKTRLGIPAIVHEEICSGLMARDATVFPQAIGLASTWEPTLVEALADTIRTQMRAVGHAPGSRAGSRRLPRPALGPPRGDVRRGPVSRRADGRRVRARPPGRRPAQRASSRRRSTSSATAPPRAA